jgi:hypothetical protein
MGQCASATIRRTPKIPSSISSQQIATSHLAAAAMSVNATCTMQCRVEDWVAHLANIRSGLDHLKPGPGFYEFPQELIDNT